MYNYQQVQSELGLSQLSPDELKEKAVEAAEEMAEVIKAFDGLVIERKGYWLWVSGNTKEHKEILKSLKFWCCFKPEGVFWCWSPDFMPKPQRHRPYSKRKLDSHYATDSVTNGSYAQPPDNVNTYSIRPRHSETNAQRAVEDFSRWVRENAPGALWSIDND